MTIKADFLLRHAGELVTVAGNSLSPKRGAQLADIGLIGDGAVAASGGVIVAVGPTAQVEEEVELSRSATVCEALGKVVLPGLVDPHTHLVFAGSREYELEERIGGAGYLEILARGGGILDTVRATRAADSEELVQSGTKYLNQMLAQGTTTAEVKSGYGLTVEDEVKILDIIRELDAGHPVDLLPTFMGAHAVAPEYRHDPEGYVRLVTEEMLPRVAGLAQFCDVFCEQGVFSVEQSRRILREAAKWGLKLKLHADEVVSLGGTELAVEMGAVSADHLMAVSREGIRRLAASTTVAVLLPATTFCLMGNKYAPAREMIDQGVAVALASDFNPGSSPVNSLPVVMGIACRQLKMVPAEVIAAVTINAAHAVGVAARVGSLEVGKKADMVIFDAPNYRYLMYRFGTNLVNTVIKSGKVVIEGDRYE